MPTSSNGKTVPFDGTHEKHRAGIGFVAGAVGAPEIETEPLLEYEVVIVGKSALVPRRPSRDSLEKLTWISREEGAANLDNGQ